MKVVVEKSAAEGLPAGWIKEIKVTKKGRKVRRDPYYSDPISGYVFRSMRDALRYVQTGEPGKKAFKPREKGDNDEDLEDDKSCSPAEADEQKLETGEPSGETMEDLKVNGMVPDEQDHHSASTKECSSLLEDASDQCRVSAQLNSSSLPETKQPPQTQDPSESKPVPCTSAEVVSDQQTLDSQMIQDEVKKTQHRSKRKKELNVPRRASKRLAGIALEPTPELKTPTRARRTAIQQSSKAIVSEGQDPSPGDQVQEASACLDKVESEPKANCAFESPILVEISLESNKSQHPSEHSGVSNGDSGVVVAIGNEGDKRQDCTAICPVQNVAVTGASSQKSSNNEISGPSNNDGNAMSGLTDIDANEMSRPSTDLPLADLWTDPCIAFAIKTLTGITFDPPRSSEMSSESNNRSYPSQDLSNLEGHGGNEETENKTNKKQAGLIVPQGDKSVPGHSEIAEHDKNTFEKQGFPFDLPYADIWRDPCIEFAIKTLTGAIPVGYEMDNQDYFQQPISSSQTQASSGLPLHDVNIDNFCQTDFLCQQYDMTEKPVSAFAGNVSLGNQSGARLHQRSEERRREFSR